jgi:periplasmic divalent cation tolerance protein
VLTTAGTREEAAKIAGALVERRLAACVNLVAVESVYRWKEAVESTAEWLLVIKTTAAAFEEVEAAIQELHSYELPECVALAIEAGSEDYLEWIGDNVASE